MSVHSTALLGVCALCGKHLRDDNRLCLSCCKEVMPDGPPLKRLRRFGFKVTYAQRQCMNIARDVCRAIPTEVDAASQSIKMSHLFVACDGKTYIGHEWISHNAGYCYSWSESYTPNTYRSGPVAGSAGGTVGRGQE